MAPTEEANITRRIYEYAYGIDQRDWELYRSIFADNIVVDFSSYNGSGGAAELSADRWVSNCRSLFTGLDATQHSMSNPIVDVTGDRARCRMYMQAAHFLDDDPRPEFTIGGFYDDTLVRADGIWLISAVTLTVWWRRGNADIMPVARQRGAAILARSAGGQPGE